MKNLIIILSIFVASSCIADKAQGQIITDTLQWLKTNIEQQNKYYVGKPLGVLLDTLRKRNIYPGIWQYTAPIKSDGTPAEARAGDTVYTANFMIYFGNLLFGKSKIPQIHRDNLLANTHLRWMYLEFTKLIPFPSNIIFDPNTGDQFGSVEGICRPFIVRSVIVGEY